ncbi:Vs.5 conserved hypothetical protein [Escherichia phage PP01]|uniref:Uncharacterized protein n=1 Tax=Escherichia phage PP01 TaxID=2060720 RepID=A0A2Z5WL74_9CAUD|nr:Vs.5 conserved hypothetical protein [Escherichia phage PP01]BBC14458.1 Vs.5 conserved hypothetical protein [Escherichia phage PP01]
MLSPSGLVIQANSNLMKHGTWVILVEFILRQKFLFRDMAFMNLFV